MASTTVRAIFVEWVGQSKVTFALELVSGSALLQLVTIDTLNVTLSKLNGVTMNLFPGWVDITVKDLEKYLSQTQQTSTQRIEQKGKQTADFYFMRQTERAYGVYRLDASFGEDEPILWLPKSHATTVQFKGKGIVTFALSQWLINKKNLAEYVRWSTETATKQEVNMPIPSAPEKQNRKKCREIEL